MKKILVLLILSFLLTSCSMTGGLFTGSSTPEEITKGDGLSARFSVDGKGISLGRLEYELRLQNHGREPIELIAEDNFRLTTKENLEIITEESIQDFYNKVMPSGNTILQPGQEMEVSGILRINEQFVQDTVLEQFSYMLAISYDYTTDFSAQALVDPEKLEPLTITGSIIQAAPVKISKIQMQPERENTYSIYYYFQDNGDKGDITKSTVEIKDLSINFGQRDISGSCEPFYEQSSGYYARSENGRYFIDDKKGKLFARCYISIDPSAEEYATTTGGSFSYDYNLRIEDSVKMPPKVKDRTQTGTA